MSSSRVLFRFAKKGEARHLSHRDLMRAFERALRRAGLPVRMSQGFNPHPKLSILAALPVGVEADAEALEVAFEPPVGAEEARERLAAQLPPGLSLSEATTLPEGERAQAAAAAYEVQLPPDARLSQADVRRFLERASIPVRRGDGAESVEFDLRPGLRALEVAGRTLRFVLAAEGSPAPKPADVLAALLGIGPADAARMRLRRTVLLLAGSQGNGTTEKQLC